ncbi:dioxygenase [Solimonas sp. K1W22B-7]|uniref:dioxygenase family protein n=1 Tax=Solimonas sp. K1W22B-7 TaxID=2303331 RepID=UPI000E337114|nr:class III extradiol ring-cleavage dioxygenase [Solimonas sp. K1W22B-7]AXQ30014.1 dioxygenase [Solimonas sp. K1W22B-7]
MTRLPAVFVSHGSPLLALGAGATGAAWRELAAALPRPRAVVVASAHWLSSAPAVGTAEQPQTIHDFGGFPEPLFRIRYPAPGAPAVARRVAGLLAEAGFGVQGVERGLDHGVWVPLREFYPQADIPVVPLALQPRLGPAHHYRLGQALAALRDEGVLLLGSGSLTHNLHEVRWEETGEVAPYVAEFQQWFEQRLRVGDMEALLDYRRRAPQAARAHPTEEHLLPLFVALGAAGEGARAERRFGGVTHEVLAMDVYQFTEPADVAAV